jgi:hypothetical protein
MVARKQTLSVGMCAKSLKNIKLIGKKGTMTFSLYIQIIFISY